MVDWESFYNAFRAPDFIAGYEIQNRLGGGAFGEVYKARKLSIDKSYAIKFLKLDDQADKLVIERELEQVRLFASIDHPNLVTIEDMGMTMAVPYLIMGYAGDETLARRLKQGGMDRDSALRTFVQVCRGVLALHDRRLAHFDLKPGNIFLRGDVARVGDYGLSKLLVEGRSSLSFGRGTPHYMAPEMLRNRGDHRADIYSLGVILYECIAARLPFGADSGSGVILREEDDPPDFPADFPAKLRPVVEVCLRLEPEDRFDSVHGLLDEMGQTARQGDSVMLPWEPSATPPEEEDAVNPPPPARVSPSRPPAEPLGREVLSVQTLAEPDRPPTPRSPGPASIPESGGPPLTADPIDSGVAPHVPVPPREERGILGTVTTTVTLGAEVLGAILTGPVLAVLRGLRQALDLVLRGLPGVVGAGVRIVLFVLLFMGLGAATALVFMGAVMGGNLYIR